MQVTSVEQPELIDRFTRPLLLFSRRKLAGAGVLLLSAVLAVIWANSSASSIYFSLLQTTVYVGFDEYGLSKPLLLWINDGILGGIGFTMSLFITSLAFVAPELIEVAKVGIMAGSILSGVIGGYLVYSLSRKPS